MRRTAEARALIRSEKAYTQYHMIQQLCTDLDVADSELLYSPKWFAQYDHKGQENNPSHRRQLKQPNQQYRPLSQDTPKKAGAFQAFSKEHSPARDGSPS